MIEEGKCNVGMESLCQHVTCVRKSLPDPGSDMWIPTVINDNKGKPLIHVSLLGLSVCEELNSKRMIQRADAT